MEACISLILGSIAINSILGLSTLKLATHQAFYRSYFSRCISRDAQREKKSRNNCSAIMSQRRFIARVFVMKKSGCDIAPIAVCDVIE